MSTLLFVNACPRGNVSRTRMLAQVFLDQAEKNGWRIITQDLNELHLHSIDAQTLAVKEALCDRRAFDDDFFRHARAFQQVDLVLFAAPYWDLSFPSILKIWVENMYVRNLTFRYENDRCIGLCRGREAVYITTSGSPIGENDWGSGYMRAVMNALGISNFTSLSAEGLDLEGNHADTILAEAKQRVLQAAQKLLYP